MRGHRSTPYTELLMGWDGMGMGMGWGWRWRWDGIGCVRAFEPTAVTMIPKFIVTREHARLVLFELCLQVYSYTQKTLIRLPECERLSFDRPRLIALNLNYVLRTVLIK